MKNLPSKYSYILPRYIFSKNSKDFLKLGLPILIRKLSQFFSKYSDISSEVCLDFPEIFSNVFLNFLNIFLKFSLDLLKSFIKNLYHPYFFFT